MLTEKEMQAVLSSNQIDLDDVLYGPMKIEDMKGYFRRELKENMLEQGWDLPDELKDPDDDTAPVPEYLRVRPDPDTRSRFSGIYDGGADEDNPPHYGSTPYWQWMKVKYGRLAYLRAYNLAGEEIKIPRWVYGKLLVQVYDFLLGNVKNPISHKGYQLYQVKREEIDLDPDEMPEGLAFVTVYLF